MWAGLRATRSARNYTQPGPEAELNNSTGRHNRRHWNRNLDATAQDGLANRYLPAAVAAREI
jgi:hypothetical protein